jgi:hypothetical protein
MYIVGVEWAQVSSNGLSPPRGHDCVSEGLHHSPRAGQEWEELRSVPGSETNEALHCLQHNLNRGSR